MELNDWILSLHVLSAFALVGAMVIFWIMIVALWGTDSTSRVASLMRVSQIGTVLVSVGSLGTIIFGVWLAISLDAYQVWDGWVIAAIVLWAVAVELGRRAGKLYGGAGMEAERLSAAGTETSPVVAETFGASRAVQFHAASSLLVLLILIDMIWKPGA
ncbi:MAG TPA: hypothetical protein VN746_08035 [Gaiella sp.]|nr:hypothetical protein [Gaiella sp.]